MFPVKCIQHSDEVAILKTSILVPIWGGICRLVVCIHKKKEICQKKTKKKDKGFHVMTNYT